MMPAVATATLLAPCPTTPNCVSTTATDAHAIAPIAFTTSPEDAAARLLSILRAMPRSTIVSSDAQTIRVEFRTAFFHFVDDAVFVIDAPHKTIHFRSASRVGYSDLGVNRRRMESIRALFQAR
jgi:uncharacterized protein (DUF1499 family)